MKSYRKARERKRIEAEKEAQELEERAHRLASSPLLRDALKSMQKDSPDDSPNTASGRRRSRDTAARPLVNQTIIEHSAEEDS